MKTSSFYFTRLKQALSGKCTRCRFTNMAPPADPESPDKIFVANIFPKVPVAAIPIPPDTRKEILRIWHMPEEERASMDDLTELPKPSAISRIKVYLLRLALAFAGKLTPCNQIIIKWPVSDEEPGFITLLLDDVAVADVRMKPKSAGMIMQMLEWA